MNVERLRKLRDVIAESKTYDQKEYFHDCGTPACLAGHATVLALGYEGSSTDHEEMQSFSEDSEEIAGDWLDLSYTECGVMFNCHPLPRHDATKEDALAMLNRAIETGKVRWG